MSEHSERALNNTFILVHSLQPTLLAYGVLFAAQQGAGPFSIGVNTMPILEHDSQYRPGTITIKKDVVGDIWTAQFEPEGWESPTAFRLAMSKEEVQARLEARNPYHKVIIK